MRSRVWARVGAGGAGVLGAVTLVGGLTWLLLNLHGPRPATDLTVGAVLAAGGLVLLMPHRIRLPRRRTGVTVAGTAVAGTAFGLAAVSAQLCCMFAYVMSRGWPLRWARRGADSADPAEAQRLAGSASWHVDLVSLGIDLLFWGYVGLLVVVGTVLVRRARRTRDGDRVEATGLP